MCILRVKFDEQSSLDVIIDFMLLWRTSLITMFLSITCLVIIAFDPSSISPPSQSIPGIDQLALHHNGDLGMPFSIMFETTGAKSLLCLKLRIY